MYWLKIGMRNGLEVDMPCSEYIISRSGVTGKIIELEWTYLPIEGTYKIGYIDLTEVIYIVVQTVKDEDDRDKRTDADVVLGEGEAASQTT